MTFALTAKSKTKPAASGKRAAKHKPVPNRSIVESLPGLGGLGGRSSITTPTIQTKLKIREPDEKFEEEVDRVAELRGNGGDLILPSALARNRDPVGNLQRLYGNQAVFQIRNSLDGVPPAPSVSLRPSLSRILQRKCSCGGVASMSGECEECSKKPRLGLQTKLKVNEPGDRYEQEADLIADRVMRMSEPAIQRQVEPEEKEEDMVQRKAVSDSVSSLSQSQGKSEVSPIVNEVLRSPGQPLDRVTRAFMEPRFGRDFSRVRVHSGTAAEQSARDVNAHAYTMGHDIVFGRGQFAPVTHQGRRLIAHELTHVVQQLGVDRNYISESNEKHSPFPSLHSDSVELQKENELKKETEPKVTQYVSLMLARDWNPCGIEEDCPPRESGERIRAASNTLQVGSLDAPEVGEIISHFDVGTSSVRGLSRNATWTSFIALIGSENSRWEILGFSDCEGGVERNNLLRQQRANAVFQALPTTVRGKIDRVASASLSDCVGTNNTEWERSLNRSVVFRRTSATINFDEEKIEVTPPRFLCGPDVTSSVSVAVAEIGNTFAGWSADQKEEACDALDSLSTGACAWDIVELHNNAWIHQNYRPPCATQGSTPACGSSVQVGTECYYAGSPNYVIFGKMCRLCADYYLSIPLINTGYARFTKKEMRDLIDLYKGKGFSGFATPSGNFQESVAWANAGYDGWPSGGSPPAGDRSNCTPRCPLPYTGSTFRVNWTPHQFYTGRC